MGTPERKAEQNQVLFFRVVRAVASCLIWIEAMQRVVQREADAGAGGVELHKLSDDLRRPTIWARSAVAVERQ